MNNKYDQILVCYICVSIIMLLIIFSFQTNYVFSDTFNQTSTNNIVNMANNDTNNNNLTVAKNNIDRLTNFVENRINLGPDREVTEGSIISLKPIIANAITIPSGSINYSWRQLEGPKLDLKEIDLSKNTLTFMAPNRPSDVAYAFELNAIQKKFDQNINLGKDSINIRVLDTNKIAKGIATNSSIPKDALDKSNIQNQLN